MRTRAPLLLGLAAMLLLAAWTMSSRPFAAPDEASHYLRALSIANGRLLGPKAPVPRDDHTPAQLAWAAQDTRGVLVPARLSPPNVLCIDGKPNVGRAGCVEPTVTGDYHPLPYLLPAATLLLANDTSTGLWLSRAASALESLVFVLLAIALLVPGRGFSLLGLLAAITPMVLFVSSLVNPNGLEVAASLAFMAALLRLAREPARFPRWGWFAAALSGAVAVLAWQLGPVFVAIDLLVFAGLVGRPGLDLLAGSHRQATRALGATLALALGVYLIYGARSGVLHSRPELRPVLGALHAGVRVLGPVLQQAVGVFGTVTVKLPRAIDWLWWLLVVGLAIGALRLASRRDRLLYVGSAAMALVFPILFYAWLYRRSGFVLQGRYVLPVLAVLPLLAGELIERSASAAPGAARRIVPFVIAVIAVVQLSAWWINARQAAGQRQALFFQTHAAWGPPLGWWPWTAAAIGAAVLMICAVVPVVPRAAAQSPRRSVSRSAPSGSARRAPAPPA